MKIVRDNPAARRVPSRRRFALARFVALFPPEEPATTPADVDQLVLPIDRDQTAAEIFTVAIWMFVTAGWYVAAILPLPIGWAIAIAVLFTGIIIQLPLYFVGAVLVPLWNVIARTRIQNNQKLNSAAFMTLMVIASLYFGATRTTARFAAWFFFAVLILNAFLWLVMNLLRGKVQEMERRCGL